MLLVPCPKQHHRLPTINFRRPIVPQVKLAPISSAHLAFSLVSGMTNLDHPRLRYICVDKHTKNSDPGNLLHLQNCAAAAPSQPTAFCTSVQTTRRPKPKLAKLGESVPTRTRPPGLITEDYWQKFSTTKCCASTTCPTHPPCIRSIFAPAQTNESIWTRGGNEPRLCLTRGHKCQPAHSLLCISCSEPKWLEISVPSTGWSIPDGFLGQPPANPRTDQSQTNCQNIGKRQVI